MIRWRSTLYFLATWVTFEAQSDSSDVKRDLSLATSGTRPNRGLFRLVGHYFNHRMCILVLFPSIRFTGLHTSYSASNRRNSPRFGVRTKELWPSHAWGMKSYWIAITGDFAQNWLKTTRLLRTDDSMVIYTLFSTIWVTFEPQSVSRDVKRDLSLATSGTGPNRDLFRLVGNYFNHRMCILILFS
jgi:hypothetical protein